MTNATPLAIALDYIGRGWAPIPVPHRTKKPTLSGWPSLRLTAETAPQHFNGAPQNIGVILGTASSGLTDVDLDCHEATRAANYLLPRTSAVFGRAGRRFSHHLYVTGLAGEVDEKAIEFRDPTLGRNVAGSMLVEIRIGGGGKGAQSIFPGSTHESGEAIGWEERGAPTEVDGAELRRAVERVAAAALLARNWSDGKRHDAALTLGGMLARAGWKVQLIRRFVEGIAQAAGDPEFKERVKTAEDAAANLDKGGKARGFPALRELFGEPVAKAVAAWLHYDGRAERQRERRAEVDDDPSSPANNVPLISEDEAGILFAETYHGKLRFSVAHGRWFMWDGHIWRENTTNLAFTLTRELVRRMAEGETEKVRISAGRATFAGAVERYARADRAFATTAEAWDRDPLLLGTPTGTVDLRTGELRPARPEDGITKAAGVTPADAADCPLWRKFLGETFGGDEDVIAFARRWAGYSLTGSTNEHALVFGHGEGGNGKSVFVNVLAGISGDYATTAAMETFIASQGEKHPTDLAMLRGARMVTASETEEGRTWAEARIKQLTGGDRISARFMRQDYFQFTPTFKLLIIGNHKPSLKNVDEAARRRFNLLPFLNKPAVKDRHLEEKLRAEWPGILRWAIEGCLEWQRDGLRPPESVKAATEVYFSDQDTFTAWLEEDCELFPGNEWRSETSADLYAAWSRYAKSAGEPPMNRKAFAERMQRTGADYYKGAKGVRAYRGVKLRPHAKLEAHADAA